MDYHLRYLANTAYANPPNAHLQKILQVVDIVAAQLEDRIGSDELDLLEADTETFRANIKTITDALSKDLSYVTEQLFRFASAPDDIVSMSSIRDRQAALLSRRRDLTSKRAAITRLASKILATHSNCIGAGVQILEQTLHGSVERGTRAQAEHLGVVAEGISKKSRIAAQQAKLNLYTPSFQSALQAYAADLDSTIARLKRSEGAAEDELAAYEEAGDGMRDIGSRFAEIKAEVERVQNEIKRVEAR
ncbi:MAG: hypothetical protein M1820_008836 [Bogoriella megaspora]|nr:MAG: hypothetical protein M1820_008836 [Bogoriella megaspora]